MSIVLEGVTKLYGEQVVVNNVSLEVKNGEFFVLLGSSGSGKTTVLNIIAGLIDADEGRVLLHKRDVTHMTTQDRKVGFVFQNYALFQYMTVADNVEFGLRVRKVKGSERRRKRDELLEMVGLVGLGNRMPRQLSGGQQQRVALARALALEPDVLLLDEPLGALDAKIRVELRRILKNIQRQFGVAAILVTHDQEEAFDLADRVGVMSFGRLIEVGTPQDLYQSPQTEFVASFLGTANILLGESDGRQVQLGKHTFPLPKETARLTSDGRVQTLFRPEDVALAEKAEELHCFPLVQGKVVEIGFSGPTERLRVELPPIEGVRAIAPAVPFGDKNIAVEASRSPEQSSLFPLKPGKKAWVGIRRLHTLAHPGLHFLLVTDGSNRSEPALVTGGHLARLAHARVTLLGLGKKEEKLRRQLQEARKQIGSGMASIETQTSAAATSRAISKVILERPADLVVLSWRPSDGLEIPEEVLRAGNHHVLLATAADPQLTNALICAASGEPGKDDVMFAGRLLRHIGAKATLMTVQNPILTDEFQLDQMGRFMTGGVQSLARFGIKATKKIDKGDPLVIILDEIKTGKYDLVIMGAPLPGRSGRLALHGVVGSVLQSAQNCSFLIVRSHNEYQGRRILR
ncbi:MAG TPA: ATP-binding cassette domain-containing protein [Anaerolineales bacterium]|nr:ATP-binding cassette domain-containing protein [Anaerolineales bacterium]